MTERSRAIDENLDRKLDQLPKRPGVYLFLDKRGKPIYIGKAKVLWNRVRSYFGKNEDGRIRYPFIVKNVADIDWVVTASDKEAVLLEWNLLRQHKPRFNVRLVDDKSYLAIKLSTNEPFPRALLVRRAKKDKALYFGPYASASAIRHTLRTIRRYFPLRTCTNAEFRQRVRPCIQHEMGRCGAPCVGRQTEAEYAKVADDVVLFLRGRNQELTERLRAKMEEEAAALRFESAARLRDQVRAIEASVEKQCIVRIDFKDRDVFGAVREGRAVIIQALFVREGKLVSTHGYTFESDLDTDEVLASFFTQFYGTERFLPDEIVFPVELEDALLLEGWLSERKGKKVAIVARPQRGHLRDLFALATDNATRAYRAEEERRRASRAALEGLKEKLGLARVPERIEGLDISTIMGVFAVGSLVSFQDGEPAKTRYRKYKIRAVERQDDTAMVGEVVERRLRRGMADKDLPDLLLIDGGAGQLRAASAVAERLGVAGDLDIASIAKARDEKTERVMRGRGMDLAERVFVRGRDAPVLLPENAPELHVFQRVRDEAHRFAVGYHRELRRARSFKTGLEEIPGIGPKRRKALLEHFGNLRGLREASVADIAACPLISPVQAEQVHAFFHEGDGAGIPDEGAASEGEV